MTLTKRERIEASYADLRAGKPKAFESFVLEMRQPVIDCVDAFCRVRPQFSMHREDLLSEGYLRLTELATAFRKPHEPLENVRAYCLKSVDRTLFRYCDRSNQAGPMDGETRRAISNGERNGERVPRQEDARKLQSIADEHDEFVNRRTRRELREEIHAACKSDLEHDAITLYLRGLNASEVAQELEVSPATISRAFERIRARYNRRQRADDRCQALGA